MRVIGRVSGVDRGQERKGVALLVSEEINEYMREWESLVKDDVGEMKNGN